MKKTLFRLMAAASLLLFGLTSCDKKDAPPKSKTVLLTQTSWKYKSVTIGGSDASSYIQACQKDNILVFAAAGTGNVNEGASKCNAGDPDTIPFTWIFNSGETILELSEELYTNGSTTMTILSLTDTELVLSIYYTPPVGPSQEMIVTFQH
jgi:hypothetical protein